MKTATFMAEVDPYELACRIAEGVIGRKRPEGLTAKQALETFDAEDRDGFVRGAKQAFDYMQECMKTMHRQQ